MKNMQTFAVFTLLLVSAFPFFSQAQCTLNSTMNTQTKVLACLSNCGCTSVIIPSGVTINMSGVWDLRSAGSISFQIQGTGSLVFSKSGNAVSDLLLGSGSALVIMNSSNTDALAFIGSGNPQGIIKLGSINHDVQDFPSIIASGGISAAPLPIELMNFEGKRESNNSIVLYWKTANEQNNKGFFVERSLDGKNWVNLFWVASQKTTAQTGNYSYKDNTINTQASYYRLRQVDFNLKETLTTIVSMQAVRSAALLLYPNPAREEINITIKEEITNIGIYDLTGRLVLYKNQFNSNPLNINMLENGMYLVKIQLKNGDCSVQRLIKKT